MYFLLPKGTGTTITGNPPLSLKARMKNGQRAFLEQLGLERQSTHSALPRVIGHNRVNSTHWSMETSPSVPFPSQVKQSKSKDQVSFAFRSPLSSAWSLSPLRSMITGIRRRSLKRAITASNQLKASKVPIQFVVKVLAHF